MEIDSDSGLDSYKNRVWSDAAVALIENRLSRHFNETIIVDSRDFWEKQLKYGSAKDNKNYTTEDALKIAKEYGVKYFRANGTSALYKLNSEIAQNGI